MPSYKEHRSNKKPPAQEAAEEDVSAAMALESLIRSGFKPERLDQLNDMFRLLGIVMGNLALLKVVTDPSADKKAVVSAARVLVSVKESPDRIAERLRASSLADLSVPQLHAIIQQVEAKGLQEVDLQSLIQRVKEDQNAKD